jgi:ubiquinone/menaquinone biosynthesis C-methylase UbiE
MESQFVRFADDIPEHYDHGLGPYIFVDFARDLTRRVAATHPQRLLEIAAGTGIVTRMMCDAVPSETQITATDLNPPMIEVARRKFSHTDHVTFQQADATALPFADAAFDTVVCQFGVMFFPDKDRSYREMYRVLVPGGRYLFNVWDSFASNPNARIQHETIASFFPQDPPGFYKLPFSYSEIEPIEASLAQAGFQSIAHTVVSVDKEIQDADRFARGVVYSNPVIEEIRRRGGIDPDVVVSAVAGALRREFGDSPGRMPLQAIVFSAQKPQ